MDVAMDSRSGGGGPPIAQFNVYDTNGVQIAEFSLIANQNGFVSTASFGNLFNLTGGQPMVVRARTPELAPTSGATLYIDSLGAPLTIGLLPKKRADGTALGTGTLFGIALGNFRSASLLIANVSGGDQSVDIFAGTGGAHGSGIFSTPRLGNNAIWRVNLTQNEALSNLIVSSTGLIIVQVVIDDGRSIQSFQVLPSQ
jgi:hypothetical protein